MGYKKWFAKHIKKEKWLFLLMILFLMVFIATVSFTPLFIGDVFDELANPDRSLIRIIKTSLFIAVAGIFRTIGDYIQSYSNEVIAHKVTRNVTEEFYDNMLEKSQEFHDRVRVGDIMARATYDTRQMNIFIAPGIKFLFEAFFTIVFSVSLMIWISPKMTLLVAGSIPLFAITIWEFNRKLEPISKAQVEQNSILNSRLQESVTGIRVVRAFVKEEEEIIAFEKETEKLRAINTRRGIISARYYAIVVTILLIAVSFLWGSYEVTKGTITLGDLVTFVMLMMTLNMPTWQIGWSITQFQIGMAAARRIYEMKEKHEYVPQPTNPVDWSKIEGTIKFENVSFSYNGGSTRRKALKEINFEVPGGANVAIIGNPGSGKSTLIKLLMRLYDTTEGAIFIDSIDIRNMDISKLRDNIGVIEQEIFLFSKSIRDNISYGRPNATYEEIVNAAKLAQAHEFITNFDNGYETIVGERGVTLSGGQKQRIAIARALLVDPVILILDDASSAIDAETERKIQTAIANVLKNRTTFIITHRLATIKNADLIIVLRNGVLMDNGTHSELIERNIDYRRLFERFSELPPMKIMEEQ
ncbi:MAG: ABC transporter ATP-binding protein [Candidatus Heimdallarchaeota archaeon]|nr:ABC transporter ATP-binding protein [Candidatus Heimdallarchaeota archaeon]